MHYSELASFAA